MSIGSTIGGFLGQFFPQILKKLSESLFNATHSAELAEQAAQLEGLRTRLAALQTANDQVERENVALSAANQKLLEDFNAREATIANLNGQVQALKVQMQEIENDVNRKKADIDKQSDADAFDALQGSKP